MATTSGTPGDAQRATGSEVGEPTTAQLSTASSTFALLGSPARLHLTWLMAQRPVDVGTLAGHVGLSIPTTSQHLAKLRLSGVATARRAGRHTYYTVQDLHVLALIEQIFNHIAPDGTLAADPPTPSNNP